MLKCKSHYASQLVSELIRDHEVENSTVELRAGAVRGRKKEIEIGKYTTERQNSLIGAAIVFENVMNHKLISVNKLLIRFIA